MLGPGARCSLEERAADCLTLGVHFPILLMPFIAAEELSNLWFRSEKCMPSIDDKSASQLQMELLKMYLDEDKVEDSKESWKNLPLIKSDSHASRRYSLVAKYGFDQDETGIFAMMQEFKQLFQITRDFALQIRAILLGLLFDAHGKEAVADSVQLD